MENDDLIVKNGDDVAIIFSMNSRVIICSWYDKINILQSRQLSENLRFFTAEEAIDILTFSITEEMIIEVSKNFDLRYDTSFRYLRNLRLLKSVDKDNPTERIRILEKIKRYIFEERLIKTDYRRRFFEQQSITLYGLGDEFLVLEKILESLTLPFQKVGKPVEKTLRQIATFGDQETEIIEMLNLAASKLSENPEKKLKIVAPSSYHGKMDLYASLFNIDLCYPRLCLKDYRPFRELLNRIRRRTTYSDYLIPSDSDNAVDIQVKEELKRLLDQVANLDIPTSILLDYLENKGRNNFEPVDKVGTELTASLDRTEDADIVLILGFNSSLLASVKDRDFLNDQEKAAYSFALTSAEENQAREELFRQRLSRISELHLSFTPIVGNQETKPLFAGEDGYEFQEREYLIRERYSSKADLILFGKYELAHRRFHVLDSRGEYLRSLRLGGVNCYDNSTRFSASIIPDHLSYSSLSKYLKCPYMFFAEQVLGLQDFEENLATKLGIVLHQIMENFNRSGEFHSDVDLSRLGLTAKEDYYLRKILQSFSDNFGFIREYHRGLGKLSVTPEMSFDIEVEPETRFVGRYDAVFSDGKYYMILDYKSGAERFDKEAVSYGFSTQLPIYLWAAKRLFPDQTSLGAFIAPIVAKKGAEKDLRLIGMTAQPTLLQVKFLEAEHFIKSFSRIQLAEAEECRLIEMVDDMIHRALQEMKDGKFSITPKRFKSHSSCQFCSYKDLCSFTLDQVIHLDSSETKSEEADYE